MNEYDIAEQAYKNGEKDMAQKIIYFVEEKDKKAGKYSIYKKLLEELKEKFLENKNERKNV